MFDIPSRTGLTARAEAAKAVAPRVTLGITWVRDDGRVSVVYAYPYDIAEHALPPSDGRPVLARRAVRCNRTRPFSTFLDANPDGAIEWMLRLLGTRHLVSLSVPHTERSTHASGSAAWKPASSMPAGWRGCRR